MKKSQLLSAIRAVCRLRHLSLRTEEAYCGWASRFFDFSKSCPDQDSGKRVGRFLSDLAPSVSANTQAQALNALAFVFNQALKMPIDFDQFAKAQRPKRLPVWLGREEIAALLSEMEGTPKLMASVCYGSGLRLMDCVRLRIKDIDFAGPLIVVRQGKGGKDRTTCLPFNLITPLQERIERLHALWVRDRADGIPGVQLPETLASKYPRAGEDWPWQWLFPARKLSRDPLSDLIRRHHIHENTLQKAITLAGRRARLNKRVTTHALRHSFAVHLLEDGCDIERIRALLGHSDIKTTAIYLHCTKNFATTMRSPLDAAPSRIVRFPTAGTFPISDAQ